MLNNNTGTQDGHFSAIYVSPASKAYVIKTRICATDFTLKTTAYAYDFSTEPLRDKVIME